MKTQIATSHSARCEDSTSQASSLFCGASDPETNNRLCVPLEPQQSYADAPVDLNAVRAIM